MDLDTRRVTGFEALVRWQHPERGLIEPGAFIPLAEETGQIVALGEQVLAKACAAAMTWQPVPETGSAPRVSVNVSPLQLSLPDFVATVQRALEDSRLAPDRLTLEVTESAVLSDFDAATRTLGQLKELGIRIALDNFGTGYSSMSYLHQLPIDVLKLDRSFVPDLASDDRLRSIVGSLHPGRPHARARGGGRGGRARGGRLNPPLDGLPARPGLPPRPADARGRPPACCSCGASSIEREALYAAA